MKVKLIKASKNKLELIKLVRWFTDLGLKECKNIVDNTPSVFEIKNKNLTFEQINKNFSSIGAIIEIEKKIIKTSDSSVGGAGSGVDITEIKEAAQIIEKKKLKEPDEYFNTLNKKADNYALARGIKSVLTVSIIVALSIPFITSFFGFYYTFYIGVFVVAVANAIILKRETNKENESIAKIASGMTFFFYMIFTLVQKIYLVFLYRIYFDYIGFSSIFSSDIFVIILAMSVSYFLVAKKNPIDFIIKTKSFNHKNNNYTSNKEEEYSKKRKPRKKRKEKF